MPININGYAVSTVASELKFGASNTRIAPASYGIRDPTLPSMWGACTDGSATYKVYPYPVNSVNINIGSCWSTSTFRFTAPATGIYYVSFAGIVGDGTAVQTAGYYSIIINGVNYYFSYKDTISVWELQHVAVMINLTAGDWLSWAMNLAPGNASSYTGGAYRSNHNMCTIWLVG